jgi:hypothetical protein
MRSIEQDGQIRKVDENTIELMIYVLFRLV